VRRDVHGLRFCSCVAYRQVRRARRRLGIAGNFQARAQEDARDDSGRASAADLDSAEHSACVEYYTCFFASRAFKAGLRPTEETIALIIKAVRASGSRLSL
jgi:hypothetical protein